MEGSPGRALAAALVCVVLAGGALAAGCGPSREEPRVERQSPAAEAEWAWLQKTRESLTRQREQLAAAPAVSDPGREALRRQTQALTDELNRRLVDFINSDPPIQGQPLSPRQQAALRMKSDEDIALARQFIDEGGDYQRAVDIYREALAIDPSYHRLEEELARAEARRYMKRGTFEQVKKGMGQDEVRGLLGQPNLHSVREYPERGVVGWFYPKDASGAAAAVWFAKSDGRLAVYLADFDALQPRGPAEPTPPAPPTPAAT